MRWQWRDDQSYVADTQAEIGSDDRAEGDGNPGEVFSTPGCAIALAAIHPVVALCPSDAAGGGTVTGEVSRTPSPEPRLAPSQTASKKAYKVAASPFPIELQMDIALNGKPNRTRIQHRVDTLLRQHGLGHMENQRLPLHGNILIPAPPDLPTVPFWAFRASGILPQRLMDGVLNAMAEAEAAGCHPHINPLKKAQAVAKRRERQGLPPLPSGGARSDYEVPFHIGVFKHPSRIFSQPWVTKDTLQGLKGDGPTRQRRVAKMMALCKSLDNLVNGRVQGLLRHLSPELLSRCRTFARMRAASTEILKHDMPLAPLPTAPHDNWPVLRFGNLGTTVAIGRGQSEKLHLDVHDSEQLPTILMVLGREGDDWDHSGGEGDLKLPTLGLSVPLYPGDILIFFASLLPHQVKLLPEEDRHKRTVATLFTCASTQLHVQDKAEKKRKRLQEEEDDEPVEGVEHPVE